jgi:hypothetical protein
MTDELPGLDENPPDDERDEEEEHEGEDPEKDEPGKPDDEVAKWRKRAESRDKKLREAQAELARLKAAQNGGEETDPVATANARLVSAEARTLLAGLGVTDKADQRAVLAVLDLSDVDVDDDGEVDTDAIEERLAELRRVLGGKVDRKRSPRVDTRDRGGRETTPADPDAARYKRILGQR